MTQSVSSGVALTATSTVTYEPDSSLPVTQTLFAMGSSRTLKHEWTKTGELFSTTYAGQQWRMSFGVGGALTTLVGPNTVATRSYNVTGALEAVRLGLLDGQVSAPLASSVLAYDSRGRIGQHAVAWSGSTSATDTFAYDRADRLRTWTRTGAGATSATYGYDPSGNLTTATVGATSTAFSYDIADRLTSAVTGSVVTTYTNDSLGRRTAAITATGTTTYAWDPLSHLTQVVSPDATATYAYGPTGMRELKTVTVASGTTWTKTAWAGSELALELDSDGTSYTYLWGPGRIPLSVTEKTAAGVSATFAYQVDAMGSVIGMTDASGAVVARYAYDPWGNPISATGTAAIATRNPLRYRAYYTDAETGLCYMPARYYDPATARFLSADPAPPSAGDPGSLNAFAYCLGDPVNASDPSGAIADIYREHPDGVTVGMAIRSRHEYTKRHYDLPSQRYSRSWVCAEHEVKAARLSGKMVIRPSMTFTSTGWTKPASYDSWQEESVGGDWTNFFGQHGKLSLGLSPSDDGDMLGDTVSYATSATGSAIYSSAAGGIGGMAAAGTGAMVSGFGFLAVAAWIGAYQKSDAVMGYFYRDDTLGDLIWNFNGGLLLDELPLVKDILTYN